MKLQHYGRVIAFTVLFLSVGSVLLQAQGATEQSKPESKLWGTGTWDADSLGNHRVVLHVGRGSDAVLAQIPWRRRDMKPEQKNVIIIDASTGKRITNLIWARLDRESGDVVFQPQSAPGDYYLYYLVYRPKGSRNYPKGTYQSMERTADEAWLKKVGLTTPAQIKSRLSKLQKASLVQFQSIDEFNSFYPMEVIATSEEVRALLRRHPHNPYLLFPEDRTHPIKMTADLPFRWIDKVDALRFSGTADKGEFYSFQVGLFAATTTIENVTVKMTDLKGPSGTIIPGSAFSSFNTDGVDWKGSRFTKNIVVVKGHVQPLWMGVQVPDGATPGRYTGEIVVSPKGLKEGRIRFELTVTSVVVEAHGDNDPFKLSRLRWLNSQAAADDSIVPPFVPVTMSGNDVSCLGRTLSITNAGLPRQITSYFSPEVTGLRSTGREILTGPVELVVENVDGRQLQWKKEIVNPVKGGQGRSAWEGGSDADGFEMHVEGCLEFDGYADFQLTLTATKETEVRDIRLDVPMAADVAKYMMGLGVKGGYRQKGLDWKWNQQLNQDAVWLGDVNAGVQLSLRDTNYVRPLNTNFYLLKPLNLPPSWYNQGKGGIRFKEEGNSLRLQAYSGQRKLRAGEKLHFYFSLLISPFKIIDTDGQWKTRYYHKYLPVDEIKKTGANTINVHHATEINPYINYPFLRPQEMKSYIDEAHSKGLKVKIYYTVRELSNRAPELFTLRSLGDEVLSYGSGGGFSWLQEHLDTNYIAAWFVPELKDAAIINSGVSRWHNYYVEGLNWLVRNVGIDGIYIDDVAFDRTTMKRVRKVLDRNRPGALIDLHSANQFNPRDGFANSANLYLEHFPYLNRLWFGEYFDYNSSPDFWLIEVSGIPFGLMGEMLEKGGNPWRGMVYGMTARLPWAGDPTPVWKLLDEFGMEGATMEGYWSPRCPVKTDNPNVLATVYRKPGAVLIALASWAPNPVECKLKYDWKALGIDSTRVTLHARGSSGFQSETIFGLRESIPIEPGKGWLLVLTEKH